MQKYKNVTNTKIQKYKSKKIRNTKVKKKENANIQQNKKIHTNLAMNYKNATIVGARYIEQSSYAQCLLHLPQCAGKTSQHKKQVFHRASIYSRSNVLIFFVSQLQDLMFYRGFTWDGSGGKGKGKKKK